MDNSCDVPKSSYLITTIISTPQAPLISSSSSPAPSPPIEPQTHHNKTQPLFFHIPPYGTHLEARGWAFDNVGRSISFIGNAIFVGTAVIQLTLVNGEVTYSLFSLFIFRSRATKEREVDSVLCILLHLLLYLFVTHVAY